MTSILYIVIGILLISNLIVSLIVLVQSQKQKNSENFTDTKCGNSITCQDGWQPFLAGNQVNFSFGYEKVGDKCYCRPGLSLVNHPDLDGCFCTNQKGMLSSSSYYTNHKIDGGIGGLNNANIGDDCITDMDCGQLKFNSDSSVDYLSNLRCDAPYNIHNPALTPKGKCQDISTLYS